MKMIILTRAFRHACLGALLVASCWACGGSGDSKESSQAQSDSTAAADTSIMGLQGDTTNSDLDGPYAAPGDTAAGQTLPEAKAKKKD